MPKVTEPTVKLTPSFRKGETIVCKSTGLEFKILEITEEGNLLCAGRAGAMPPHAAEKKL